MKVCIGIVTHNRADVLPKAIASAMAQSYANKTIVVYDSGSTDQTPDLCQQFPGVHWQRSDRNVGCLHARNEMMLGGDADLYCSLDDDAWFLAGDELALAVEEFNRNPRLAALAFEILSPDRPNGQLRTPSRPTNLFIGCGHVLRLSAVRSVGAYAENPDFYGAEETDLCLRLLDRGLEIALAPGVNIWHEKSPTSRDSGRQYQSTVCNDLALATRRFPLPDVAWLLPGKLASHMVFSLEHGLLGSFVGGVRRFAGAVPGLLKVRRAVRRETLREFRRRTRLAEAR